MNKKIGLAIASLLLSFGAGYFYQDSSQPQSLGGSGQAYAFSNASTTNLTLGANVSAMVLATSTDGRRTYAAIQSHCGAAVFLSFNDLPIVVNQGIQIASSTRYEIGADNLFRGAIRAVSASACPITVIEGR